MANTEIKKLYNGEVEITFYVDSHRYKLAGEKSYLLSATAITGIIDKSRVLINWAIGLTGSYLRKYLEEASSNNFTSEELAPIIEEALNQHNQKREEAADTGSQVHDMAERIGMALKNNESIEDITKEISEMDSASKNPELSEEEANKLQNVVNGITAFIDWVVDHNVKFIECERMVYSRKNKFVGTTDAIVEIDGKRYLIDYKTSKSGNYPEYKFQIAGYRSAFEEEENVNLDGTMIIHFDKISGKFEIIDCSDTYQEDLDVFLSCLKIKQRLRDIN